MRSNGPRKDNKHSEAGLPSSKDLLESLGRFVEEVANAGVLFVSDGHQPSSKTAGVRLPEP